MISLVALVMVSWLLCTVAQVEKYLPFTPAVITCIAGCASVAAILLLLRRQYRRPDISYVPLAACFVLLLISFAVLYPKSQRHVAGKGSDREDALRVELSALVHHQYPYDARTYLHHPPTPLPGAMYLAAPFFFAGRIALQNVFWAALFFLFLDRFFRYRSTALAYAVLFLITALENLNDFDVGGDYITNIMYVSVALLWFTHVAGRNAPWRSSVAAVALFGVALSSRIVYVVVLPPVVAYVFQRNRTRRAVLLVAGVLFTGVLVTGSVFFPHPIQRLSAQLNQNADKLSALPPVLAGVTLPLTALLVASVAFMIPMTLQRIFLLAGAAALILIFPPMAFLVRSQGGIAKPLTTDLEYLAVSSLFLCLWAFATWERADGESMFMA